MAAVDRGRQLPHRAVGEAVFRHLGQHPAQQVFLGGSHRADDCTIWYTSRMIIQDRALIHAPVDVVWDVTVDVAGLPDATPTITKVEPLDALPLAVGGRARLTQPGLSTRVWTVTEVDPGRVFAWTTKVVGVRMTGRH